MEISLLRPVLRNNAALLLQYGAGAAVPLFLIPHLARSVGMEAFGALSVTLAWASWASLFVGYAFHLTAPVRAAEDPTQLPRVFAIVLAARVALLVPAIATLLIAYAANLIPSSTTGAAVCLLVLSPLMSAINSSWYLEVQNRFAEPAALSIAGTAVAVLTGVALVHAGDSSAVTWSAAALVAGSAVVATGSVVLALRSAGSLPRIAWSEVTSFIEQGWTLFASQLMAFAYGGIGPILIAWLSNLEQAGTYAVVDRLTASITGAALLLHTAAYPTLARLFRSSRRDYLRLIRAIVTTYVAGGVIFTALGWLMRDVVLAYLYGPTGPRPYALYLLGLVSTTIGIFGPAITGYFVMSGQPQRVHRLTLAVLGLSFGLATPAVMLYGAAGWLGGLVAAQILVIIITVRHWKMEHDTKRG
jgi:PST family polysaccharide transporter